MLGLPSLAIKLRDRRKIDASTVTLVHTRVSMIDSTVRWEEIAPLSSRTINKPIALRRCETGDALGHWMLVCTTRADKSMLLHTLLAQITGTYDKTVPDSLADALVWFADLKSGSVAAGGSSARIGWRPTSQGHAHVRSRERHDRHAAAPLRLIARPEAESHSRCLVRSFNS